MRRAASRSARRRRSRSRRRARRRRPRSRSRRSTRSTWDKPAVTIAIGDTVDWSFAGTTQAHNVAVGQRELDARVDDRRAGAGRAGRTPFTATGAYHFVCQVHRTRCGGTSSSAPPPPPPLSEQPFLNDAARRPCSRRAGTTTRPRLLRVARAPRRRRRPGALPRLRARPGHRALQARRQGPPDRARHGRGDGVITVRKGLGPGATASSCAPGPRGQPLARAALRLTVR